MPGHAIGLAATSQPETIIALIPGFFALHAHLLAKTAQLCEKTARM
jgi:hypothetical protein